MLCSLCFARLVAEHLIIYHESEHVDCQAPLPSLGSRAYHRGVANHILDDLAVHRLRTIRHKPGSRASFAAIVAKSCRACCHSPPFPQALMAELKAITFGMTCLQQHTPDTQDRSIRC